MGKKTKITECVYCGERKETTRDHVISSNLFPGSYEKKNVIIVPSCADCNTSFSLDEEYFRIFVCGAV
jgi:5-methylcytosine-specific restriction endonuclease McrA